MRSRALECMVLVATVSLLGPVHAQVLLKNVKPVLPTNLMLGPPSALTTPPLAYNGIVWPVAPVQTAALVYVSANWLAAPVNTPPLVYLSAPWPAAPVGTAPLVFNGQPAPEPVRVPVIKPPTLVLPILRGP
jgi:hypothetical protein